MRALIDGDILRYRCGFAAESKVKLAGGNVKIVPEAVENALYNVKNQIKQILDSTKAESYTVYLTEGRTFRDDAATLKPYKGNRDPSHKPVHYSAITEYISDHHPCEVVRGIEADDAMGIAQCTLEEETVICSIDKDMDMIPGWHYNFVKDIMYQVSDDEADYNFYHQLATGDSTDNIPGIPGVGPVGARRLLVGCDSNYDRWISVSNAYSCLEDCLENARLIWIWRKPNDLWEPPEKPEGYADPTAPGQEERAEEESAITYG